MNNPDYSNADKALIKSLKKGRIDAFKAIFRLYERRLYYFVFSYAKSEYIAEEITQEIFIKIWEEREKIDLNKSFHSYIFTLTKNRTFNYLRDASRREVIRKELWNNVSKEYEHIENNLFYSEYQKVIEDIVEALPQSKRSVYRLSAQQGKSHSEIASLLGLQIKTVKNHLWKAKETIKLQLRPHVENIIKFLCLFFFS
ncbi:RNA polymerase sigma factor [Flavivirga eckloniae]|uniref:RNA polymerase sigma-70 factor n=1 Tax=Flavivirga eckloniae TaxID=1803846 RepID=A0A2K9PU86_9FLAO|nr:RNA polymerase sigma-70 factor [Flavivirga eckloniae]AUP80614.1 hypothetical protein C1H87_18610 [Flavivirga eckloniae]